MKRFVVIICAHLLVLSMVLAQSDVTPTPQPIQSIFDYDTCAPPCWMGLIPGESTSADIQQMFREYTDLIDPKSIDGGPGSSDNGEDPIDPQTGLIRIGGYRFAVGKNIDYQPGEVSSRIEISDGVIDLMLVKGDDKLIPLSLVLERLGLPDIIRIDSGSTRSTWLLLIYLLPRLRVNLYEPTDVCMTTTLMKNMNVDSILYFSPAAAMRLRKYDVDVLQPNLTGYTFTDERDVSNQMWQSWLNGEVDMSCKEAWEQLPQPEVTPAPEVTVEPAATEQP